MGIGQLLHYKCTHENTQKQGTSRLRGWRQREIEIFKHSWGTVWTMNLWLLKQSSHEDDENRGIGFNFPPDHQNNCTKVHKKCCLCTYT